MEQQEVRRQALRTIAVTGATGQLGSRVARMLAERGIPQRLVVRAPGRAPRLDGAEVSEASYEDTAAMRTPLSGVDTVFLASAHEGADRMPEHRSAVRAAADAGVQRVVYTSFMGAAPLATFPSAREHSLTEQLIVESGLRLTALRNALYADVVPHFVGADGVIRGPAGQGKIAWVARLAVEGLLDPAHADPVYDVSGPEPIDLATPRGCSAPRPAARSATSPRPTSRRGLPGRAPRSGRWPGGPGRTGRSPPGETSVTSHAVEHVTGLRPWTFEEFLRNEPDAWQHMLR